MSQPSRILSYCVNPCNLNYVKQGKRKEKIFMKRVRFSNSNVKLNLRILSLGY